MADSSPDPENPPEGKFARRILLEWTQRGDGHDGVYTIALGGKTLSFPDLDEAETGALYVMDEDGAAILTAQILAVAITAGRYPDFTGKVESRLEEIGRRDGYDRGYLDALGIDATQLDA